MRATCAGVVPQQPPTSRAPGLDGAGGVVGEVLGRGQVDVAAADAAAAGRRSASREHRGAPAAARAACSSTSSVACGPTPQLTPTTSAPAPASAAYAAGRRVAVRAVLPSVPNVICAIDRQRAQTRAHRAQRGQDLVQVVERLEHEQVDAALEQALGRPRGTRRSASATAIVPKGSSGRPSGPIEPATNAGDARRSRARRAPCARPGGRSRAPCPRARGPRGALRFAPKVLVSMSSAPAAR